nr:hypothetical protein [uncultured Kingella sp.]
MVVCDGKKRRILLKIVSGCVWGIAGQPENEMERRRLVAKLFIKQDMAGLPRCRQAADAPLGWFSGCPSWQKSR